MTILLHHLFVLSGDVDSCAELLREAGMLEGSSNNHPGQGTANRRFFFRNLTLELLYVRDAEESEKGPGRNLRLVERESNPSASPFGLIFSQSVGFDESQFPGWRYHPDYFHQDLYFQVGNNSNLLLEPLCIVMPSELSATKVVNETENTHLTVTGFEVSLPVAEPSVVLKMATQCQGVSLKLNEPHNMVLILNDGASQEVLNLNPAVPLSVCR